jgi:hypothetical protein
MPISRVVDKQGDVIIVRRTITLRSTLATRKKVGKFKGPRLAANSPQINIGSNCRCCARVKQSCVIGEEIGFTFVLLPKRRSQDEVSSLGDWEIYKTLRLSSVFVSLPVALSSDLQVLLIQ